VAYFAAEYPLFQEVIFKNGINFIYGKKDEVGDPRSSLNSIGKSTFLDLIDFCLLASNQRQHNPRIHAAEEIISTYNIVLEFDIENESYIIKRSFQSPKVIQFGNVKDELEELDVEDAKIQLANKIFKIADYSGTFSPKWFRKLMSFYLKIQKFKKDQFNDPIKYIKESSESELVIYHLYLMGLDNQLSFNNYRYLKDLKEKQPIISELKRLIQERYSLQDFKETNKSINKLRLEIKKLDQIISTFKLEDQYEEAEEQANSYTKLIKERWFENFTDRKKIEAYESSFNIKDSISTTKIKNLYKEVSENFADYVKATLDDAIKFRNALSASRRSFLADEMKQLQANISVREGEIGRLEDKRAKLFSFLSAQDAIKDLTEAFSVVSEKRNELAELEGNFKTYNDLLSEKNEIELEIKKNENEILRYITSIDTKISDFYESFTEIYNKIYVENQNESSFTLEYNKKSEKLVDIKITLPDMYGKGKNQGRTLIYDLFILINSARSRPSFPKFLIHDGIFDGVDKAHFIAAYEYIEQLANSGLKIQYITTINEEGTLSKSFGDSDILNPKVIEDKAILVLTPTNKLFGKDFSNSI
jgi:uncharacterized protein YydD (DUF2326 family)